MTYTVEKNLENFEFWSGARDTAKYLTSEDFDIIEMNLQEYFMDTPIETEINDFFWFEDDEIAKMLGYSDFEELMQERKEN